MTVQNLACPPESMLSDFGLGKLDAANAETVSQHLETCDDCRQRVANLSGDSFVNRLRGLPDDAARPGRIEHTFIAGESASNVGGHTPWGDLPRSSKGNDGLGRPPHEKDGLGRPPHEVPSAPPELANHPDYELIKELGRGGMGVVYLAKNRMMDRLEVLKVVSKALLDKPGSLERFQQEIRSAAKLLHPNIVAAHAVLRPGDLLVFAMEYVPGNDLMQVVKKRGYLPVANAAFYAHQVAVGLQHAHETGMVHRDIKPNNLMLAIVGKKHVVKILDFGLAKATSEKAAETALTKSGQMLGTPDYIAPEQTLDAHQADIRADIYSLGCTLYYLLAGRPPFQEASLYALLEAHQRRDAQPLNFVRPDVPVELAAVVGKMLAKDPAKRYQTPIEVARALTPFFKPGQAVQTATLPPRAEATPSEAASGTIDAAASATDESIAAQSVPVVPLHAPAAPIPASLSPIPVAEASPAFGISIDTHRNAGRRRGWWRSLLPWQQLSIAGGAAGAILLGVVLLVRTPHGTVEITLDDPNAKVTLTVDKDTIEIKDLDHPLSFTVGEHNLTVKGEGFETITEKFSVTKGKNAPLTVTLVRDKSDHEREVAKWVLSRGGKVSIEGVEGEIADVAKLRVGRIALTRVNLTRRAVTDGDLVQLQDLPNLTDLDLFATSIGDAGLMQLKGLPRLKRVKLAYTKVTNDGLRYLSQFKDLDELVVYGTSVTGEGLQHLRKLPSLVSLWLDNLPIDDDALAELRDMRTLANLRLQDSRITDRGLEHLKRLTTLKELLLNDTKVTREGIASLQAALPDCKIHTSLAASTSAAAADSAPEPLSPVSSSPAGAVSAAARSTPRMPLLTVPTLFLQYQHRGWNVSGAVALSPDGTKLLASEEGVVRLWNAATGQVLRDVAPAGDHNFITFLPDGKRAAIGDLFGQVTIWDIATGNRVGQYQASTEVVKRISASDDGRLILACYSGHCERKPDGGQGSISGSGGRPTAVVFWNIDTQEEVQRLDSLGGHVRSAAFLPHGHHVVWGSDKGVLALWDADATKQLNEIERDLPPVHHLSVSQDGRSVAAALGNWTVGIWDLETRKRVQSIGVMPKVPRDPTMSFVFLSPDGSRVLTLAEDDGARLWDVATGAEIANNNRKGSYYHAAFFPDGRSAVLAPPKGDIFKWQLPTALLTKPAAKAGAVEDHEREVAEWVIARGGKVRVKGLNVDISDAAKLPVAALQVTEIGMEGIPIPNDELAIVHDLPTLGNLHIRGALVTDDGLARFKELPMLSSLYLGKTKVTDSGMRYVALLNGLTQLDLTDTAVGDNGLEHLANGLPNLRKLYLRGTRATAAGIQYLAKARIEELDLGGSVDDTALQQLAALPTLNRLGLSGDGITNAGLRHLKSFKSLRQLAIDCRRVDDDGLRQLESESLEDVNLSGATGFTGKGLRYLQNLPRLRKLWLGTGLPVYDDDLAALLELNALRDIHIHNGSASRITDAGLEYVKQQKNLTSFCMGSSPGISAEGVESLRAALPNCQITCPVGTKK
jgi:serine/threonine protein kinase/WD40 repeat protein